MSQSDRRIQERRRHAVVVPFDRRRRDRRQKERRDSERIPLELWMEEISGDDVYLRRTGNISVGGAYFDQAIPHALGTMITLKFTLPTDGEMVVARGEVVNAAQESNGLGMGVKFISFEGDGEARIADYVETCSLEFEDLGHD